MVLELLKHGHPEADRKVRSCIMNCGPCSMEHVAWPHLAVLGRLIAVQFIYTLYRALRRHGTREEERWPQYGL